MNTIILTTILALLVSLFLALKGRKNSLEDVVLMCAVCSCLGAAIGVGIGYAVNAAMPSKVEFVKTDTYYLESMQDNSSVGGTFFLGSGKLSTKMIYTFYSKEGQSSFRLMQIPARNTTIKYSTGKPRVVRYRSRTRSRWAVHKHRIWYNVYVPKGTIKNNYNLDAK